MGSVSPRLDANQAVHEPWDVVARKRGGNKSGHRSSVEDSRLHLDAVQFQFGNIR